MKEQFEQLDSKKIISAIAPCHRLLLTRLDILKSVDSTNTYLLNQAKICSSMLPAEKSGWVCFAEQQWKGRGRQGKEWFSPEATNLYCSLTWNFPAAWGDISALSIACAAMVIRALRKIGIQQGMGLKWPNDILFQGRKLSGILLENMVSPQSHLVVIGIGLNLRLPEEKKKNWVDVEEALGKSVSRNRMAGILLDEVFAGISLFQAHGLMPFLPLCRELDVLQQKKMSIYTSSFHLTGLGQGINDKGELLLIDEEGKEHHFCYGEVSVENADNMCCISKT